MSKKKRKKKDEDFQGKELLLRDLKELMGLLEGDCTPESFLVDLEEVYSEVVAMLISSLPGEEQKEALTEHMEILIATIIDMMGLYGSGSEAEQILKKDGDIPPEEGGGNVEKNEANL